MILLNKEILRKPGLCYFISKGNISLNVSCVGDQALPPYLYVSGIVCIFKHLYVKWSVFFLFYFTANDTVYIHDFYLNIKLIILTTIARYSNRTPNVTVFNASCTNAHLHGLRNLNAAPPPPPRFWRFKSCRRRDIATSATNACSLQILMETEKPSRANRNGCHFGGSQYCNYKSMVKCVQPLLQTTFDLRPSVIKDHAQFIHPND